MSLLQTLEVQMPYHVVYSAKYSVAAVPVTQDTWVVLCFVPRKILLAREAPACRLRASLVPTEEGFGVPLVVLPQVTPSREDCS